MRLTLRTLLAYLDDTLDPVQARQIGQKVAESDVARELIDRIKKVTRRRGLNAPPAGDDLADPNTVAAYLDNDLPAEKVTEVEDRAMHSEVHLAEIAACHQLLALIVSEPARVPPTARQRMYGLVTGPEAIPGRKAVRVAPATVGIDMTERTEDIDVNPFLSRRSSRYRIVAAAVLAALLLIVLWVGMPERERPSADSSSAVADNSARLRDPDPAPPPEKEAPKEPAKPAEKDPVKPTDAVKPPAKEPDKPPPVEPAKPVVVVAPKPSEDRKELGKFVTKDGMLLQAGPGGTWVRIPPEEKLTGASYLVSLPALQSELRMNSGIKLLLWGNVPELTPVPALECRLTLFSPPAGADADFALDRGRVYISTTNAGKPAVIWVRIAGQAWELTLPDEKAEVLIQATASYAGGRFPAESEPIRPPVTTATIGAVKGTARLRIASSETALTAPPGPAEVTWNSTVPPTAFELGFLKDLPPFWSKQPPTGGIGRERAADIDAAARRLGPKLGEKNKAIELVLAELSQDRDRGSRTLAVYGLAALDMLPQLLEALDEAAARDIRAAAMAALQHWVCRGPENAPRLYEHLVKRKGFSAKQAETAIQLLFAFSEAELRDPATYVRLLAAMEDDKLALRALAYWRLETLDPDGAARIRYDPADNADARDRALQEWRRRLGDGKIPPGRTKS